MAQLPGQLITDDGERIGLIQAVEPAAITQRDLLKKDRDTGEIVERITRPVLDVQVVSGIWEDGSAFVLTQTVDSYVNLGSVVELDKEVTDVDPAAVSAVAERFPDYANEVRAAAPFADASREAARNLEIVEDEG